MHSSSRRALVYEICGLRTRVLNLIYQEQRQLRAQMRKSDVLTFLFRKAAKSDQMRSIRASEKSDDRVGLTSNMPHKCQKSKIASVTMEARQSVADVTSLGN